MHKEFLAQCSNSMDLPIILCALGVTNGKKQGKLPKLLSIIEGKNIFCPKLFDERD